MVNIIQLALNLVCILRTKRTCKLTVRFSKYIAMLICLVRVVALSYN